MCIKFDYLTDSIIVEFDPALLTKEHIKNSLEKSGYKFVRLGNRVFEIRVSTIFSSDYLDSS